MNTSRAVQRCDAYCIQNWGLRRVGWNNQKHGNGIFFTGTKVSLQSLVHVTCRRGMQYVCPGLDLGLGLGPFLYKVNPRSKADSKIETSVKTLVSQATTRQP